MSPDHDGRGTAEARDADPPARIPAEAPSHARRARVLSNQHPAPLSHRRDDACKVLRANTGFVAAMTLASSVKVWRHGSVRVVEPVETTNH